jgi:hypothetical protein
MSRDRKNPSAALWATVVVVVALVAYPLTIGPFFWLVNHVPLPEWLYSIPIYAPIQWIEDRSPKPVGHAIEWYIHLWT